MGRTRPDRLSVATQALWLGRRFPDAQCIVRGSALRWRGELQPMELSRRYPIVLRYAVGHMPEVRVGGPPLARFQGRRLPHTYRDGSLCLFYPRANEWTPLMRLADTVVPWASEWLFFYEAWLLTGEWLGGGHEPRKRR